MSAPANQDVSPRYKWWVVGMLWFVCFFNYADRQAIYAVFPTLKHELGFTNVELALIGSAFMWVYAAGAPVAGFITDRFRRKDLILGGCLFWSLVTVTTGWSSTVWQFVTVRALEGFGETFYMPASLSLVSDYHDGRTRSRALAWHQSSVYIGTIFGSWLGAWFAEHHGWRLGFYFFGAMGMLLAAMLYRVLREPRRGEAELSSPASAVAAAAAAPTISETLAAIFRTPVVPFLMLAFVLANFVATIFLTWTPTFLVEKFGFKLTSAGLSGTIFIHLASAIAVPLAGWLADHLTRRYVGGRMVVQAAGLLIGAVFVLLVATADTTVTLLVAMTGFGVCKGFYDSGIFASMYDAVEPRMRGAAAGLMNTVGWGGGALGPIYVGVATQYGRKSTEVQNMSDAIAFGAVIYLVGTACLLAAIFFATRQVRILIPVTDRR
jgi:MFS family permease